ncbi:MAG: homoserine O-succinyltransferase [Gracilibacteraceae bacterium]|jgi:homoserine O-succinyltransferase|nr:homoserine O-succinyltransferase [Gracilibacteraceae bacterium]
MPIRIADDLPARGVLERENIFVMGEDRAMRQDIRPLRIALLNLMPTKIITETQYLRLLSNSPLQVDVTLLHTRTHMSANVSGEHLTQFYKTYYDVREERFDGLIITGAPVELMEFEEVDYWKELVEIMLWSRRNVFSTMFVCWGAQAALYYFYGIKKRILPEKMFGVFAHRILRESNNRFLRGFDDLFQVPHSRHTGIDFEDVAACPALEILAFSEEAGVCLIAGGDGRQLFITGHPEYDPLTLKAEYDRDLERGVPIAVPKNYFPGDDPSRPPLVTWRSHAHLLMTNWLNYYVYQDTPFDLSGLDPA